MLVCMNTIRAAKLRYENPIHSCETNTSLKMNSSKQKSYPSMLTVYQTFTCTLIRVVADIQLVNRLVSKSCGPSCTCVSSQSPI